MDYDVARVASTADVEEISTLTGDTGLWALAAVAVQHRVSLDRLAMAHELALGGRTARTADILRAAKSAGLVAQAISGADKRKLTQVPAPAILLMRDGRYVVLGQRAKHRYEVFTFEAAQSTQRTLDDIAADWSGEIIVVSGKTEAAETADTHTEFGIRWFFPIIWRHKRTLAHILVASLFVQLFSLITAIFFQVVIDKVLVHNSLSTLLVVSVSLALIGLFHAALQYLRTYAISHTASRVDVELSRRVFAHLLNLPLAFYERSAAGQILARMREIDTIRVFLTGQATTVALDILFTVVLLAFLFAYSLKLSLVVIISVPAYMLVGALIRSQLRVRIRNRFSRGAESQQFLVESVVCAHTLKAAAVEPLTQTQWDEKRVAFAEQAFQANSLGGFVQVSIQYVGTLTTVGILFFGAQSVMSGELTIGELIAFNMIASQIAAPILRLSQLWQDFQQVQVSVSRLGDIMNATPETRASTLAGLPELRGSISFRNVSFRYTDSAPEVLHDISLDIPAGQIIGIVGSSGCGKSTLAKLIQRLYLPQHGQILIDGIDIAQVHPAWIRRQSGVVLQETLLFNRSIHGNIAFAAPYMTRDHVIAMARLAGAHEFISKLPQGYDTLIEERGTSLSGGQRQRIAIARALAMNPRILILDEATSALDYESEVIIQTNLQEIVRDRTVVIIAHRLSMLRQCDRIISIADGRIVEDGTHDELLRRERGVYRHLWQLQNATGGA